MNRFRLGVAALVVIFSVAGGCQSKNYYRIEDGSTGKTYLTREYTKSADGQVTFTDSISQKKVTILNAGIEQLDEGQYQDSVRRAEKQPGGNQ
jgi:hypothetical protein